MRKQLTVNAYSENVVNVVTNRGPRNKKLANDNKAVCVISIACIRGVSEKFRTNDERLYITTLFRCVRRLAKSQY